MQQSVVQFSALPPRGDAFSFILRPLTVHSGLNSCDRHHYAFPICDQPRSARCGHAALSLESTFSPRVIGISRPFPLTRVLTTTESDVNEVDDDSTYKPDSLSVHACNESNDEEDDNAWQFAYVLGTFAAAVSGGYSLGASGVLFLLLGRQVQAPAWICSLAALLTGGLVDALVLNSYISVPLVGRPTLLPYIFFTGSFVVSAVFDFDAVFRTLTPGTRPKALQESDGGAGENVDDISQWDRRMTDKQSKEGDDNLLDKKK